MERSGINVTAVNAPPSWKTAARDRLRQLLDIAAGDGAPLDRFLQRAAIVGKLV